LKALPRGKINFLAKNAVAIVSAGHNIALTALA
jgi:hypothetical protein